MNSSTPASLPPPESLPRRLARSAAWLGLALILAFLLGLLLLSSSTSLANAVTPLFTQEQAETPPAVWITLAFFVVVAGGLWWAGCRLRLRSGWWVGAGYLAAIPVLVYLAIDDPVLLDPMTIEEIAPAFPGAEKSYAVVMQYSKQRPSDEAKAFAQWKPRIIGFNPGPDQPAEWNAFLIKNRAEIEADWADLAPQRRWLAELNAFDRFGDLGAASDDANIPTFQVWQVMARRSVHVAGLRLLDGRPDDAIETLLPVLQAGRKLQPSSRSLVRGMIGIVAEKTPLEYAARIVENAAVSAETRGRLAAAIAGGVRGEAGVRRLIAVDAPAIGRTLLDMGKFDYRGFRSLYGLVFNPRRSVNLLTDLNREFQELAARREIGTSRADEIYREKTRLRFKNLWGTICVDRWTPAYSKVVRAYWDLHDARERLGARLAAAP